MTDFLIESAVCQLVLLAVYHLWLEREKMHRFNRFFLLSGIGFSFAVPFINIEVVSQTAPVFQAAALPLLEQLPAAAQEKTDYLPPFLWSIYGLATLMFALRFIRNILRMTRRKAVSEMPYGKAKLVLLEEETLPHTFLNTIFVNEKDFYNRRIEAELYQHELTHVIQKHTLDVLLIEILKTVFWFNPILIFYKKAIQLNHEYLADEKVVEKCHDVPFYQKLLISKADFSQRYALSSNLNYSVTKKRLIMMTKTTSKPIAFLRKIAVLPVVAGLIFCLSVQSVAQVGNAPENITPNRKKTNGPDPKKDAYYAGIRVKINDYANNVMIDKPYEELTQEQKDHYLWGPPLPYTKKSPTRKELEDFKNAAKYAIWVDGKHVPNTDLDKFSPEELVHFSGSAIMKNARSKKFPQPFQFWFATEKYFDETMKNDHLKYNGEVVEMSFYSNNQFAQKKADKIKAFRAAKTAKARKTPTEKITETAALTENPQYEGGLNEFMKYIAQNYKIPEGFPKNNGKGKIIMEFTIEEDGSISNVKTVKDLGYGTGNEAKRVLENAPKWKPGKKDGKPVRTSYTLPIALQ